MHHGDLQGKKVAILVADGFEQVELTGPREALDQAGAQTAIVSPAEGQVKGWNHTEWGDPLPVDVPLQRANPEDYDALLLPGGVMNPDKLRANPTAVRFVKSFVDAGKPIAAICHGPWTLIEAGAVRGRKMTSSGRSRPISRTPAANWVDQEAVTDGNLVTSRKPDDIPAFNRAMVELFAHAEVGARR